MDPWDLSLGPRRAAELDGSAGSTTTQQTTSSGYSSSASSTSSQASSNTAAYSLRSGLTTIDQPTNSLHLLKPPPSQPPADLRQPSLAQATTTDANSPKPPQADTSHAVLDRKARKKDQNRRAAYNYRRKKMEEKNRLREEEMRLVYSRVCLIGYADELEGTIMYILNTKTRKILDKDGGVVRFLCPVCLQSCDNLMNLRGHLNVMHHFSTNGANSTGGA